MLDRALTALRRKRLPRLAAVTLVGLRQLSARHGRQTAAGNSRQRHGLQWPSTAFKSARGLAHRKTLPRLIWPRGDSSTGHGAGTQSVVNGRRRLDRKAVVLGLMRQRQEAGGTEGLLCQSLGQTHFRSFFVRFQILERRLLHE